MDTSPSTNPTVLLLGSCQFPPDVLRSRAAYKTKVLLRNYVRDNIKIRTPRPEFALLMAGDNIYADATAGLFDPVDEINRYKKAYELVQESSQEILLNSTSILRYSTIDDHEIVDNWEPANPQPDSSSKDKTAAAENEKLMLQGKQYFIRDSQSRRFQRNEAKPILEDVKDHGLWYPVNIDSAPVFLMDTRTDREPRTLKNLETAKLITEKQFKDLETWLRQQVDLDEKEAAQFARPKFILSGSMPLPRTRRVALAVSSNDDGNHIDRSYQLGSDSWDGYPATLNKVLALAAELNIKNLFFLSGDAHIPCIATATVKDINNNSEIDIGSIHAAPLYAPFPFANANPADFAAHDQFSFHINQQKYKVSIETEFPEPGNGFVAIDNSDADKGQLHVEFHTGQNAIFSKSIPLAPNTGFGRA